MSVIVLLIAAGGLVAAGFLGAFVWAVSSGQFDDTATPAVRVLLDDAPARSESHRQARHRPRGVRLPADVTGALREEMNGVNADVDVDS